MIAAPSHEPRPLQGFISLPSAGDHHPPAAANGATGSSNGGGAYALARSTVATREVGPRRALLQAASGKGGAGGCPPGVLRGAAVHGGGPAQQVPEERVLAPPYA